MRLYSGIIPKQRQMITNKQIQELEILSMDNVALYAFLQREYNENPMLEQTVIRREYTETTSDENRIEAAAPDNLELFYYLMDQLDLNRYTGEEIKLMHYLIDCLDDNGYFKVPVKEVAEMNHVEEVLVERCLYDLEELEPYGIFARDLSHCLLIQLKKKGILDPEIKEIILHHLPEMAEGKLNSISKSMGISLRQINQYKNIIERLVPKPLAGFARESAIYIIPDIIFHKNNGEWEIVLNDQWIGEYQLNEYYLKLIEKEKEEAVVTYFKTKLERARFLIHCIEQRRSTMLKLGEAILNRQNVYFNGIDELNPMSMEDLANDMGVSVSTISRCVKGKYVQYPKRTVLMRLLFSAGMGNPIKTSMKKIILSEDKRRPYSDQEIKELLEQQNISLSRRAISKYRTQLGFKGSFERRQA